MASVAIGEDAKATGDHATAVGEGTVGEAFREIVLGSFSQSLAPADPVEATTSATTWRPEDTLLTVGNGRDDQDTDGDGSPDVEPSNALVILKDGTVLINPSGDISMGDFDKGPTPNDLDPAS